MDSSVLCHAIWKEDLSKVQELVSSGVDVNGQNENGFTPLMQAAEMQNLEITQFLIKNGADVNGKGYADQTALFIAVDSSLDGEMQTVGSLGEEPLDVILFLLSCGADKNAKTHDGNSPRQLVESYNSERVLKAFSQ